MKKKPERILLIEDEEAHAELVRRSFEDSGGETQLVVARTLKDARKIIAEESPDVVFIDLILPDGNGMELLSEFDEDTPYPAVIVTSHGNENVAVGAMKSGALDYVVKSAAVFSSMPQIAERVFREWTHVYNEKVAERALLESEAQSRAILAAIPDKIYRVHKSGRIVFYKEMLDAKDDDASSAAGKNIRDVFPWNVAAVFETTMLDTMKDGLTRQFECDLHTKGRAKHFEVRIARISSDQVIAISRDVTGKHEIESQLRQSQKLDALGQLAGGVAHDFNNLLTGILGFSSMLMDDLKDNASAIEDLQEIVDAAERAAELTSTLLSFSRRQMIQTSELNMNEQISKFVNLLRRMIGEDIELELQFDKELALISADPMQMELALMNLVINASDAIKGHGKISIETGNVLFDAKYIADHPWAKQGRYVLFSVSDDGCGIPTEIREHIFEPFFTTKQQGEGTGLGLATVYGIVSQHGGFVHFYSEPGIGTTFEIYLPVSSRKAEDAETKIEARIEGGAETILFADDEDILRKSATRVLENAGYKVIAVNEGQEAVDVFRDRKDEIDIVVLDVVMPKKNGDEAACEIMGIRRDIKLVLSSGYSPARAGKILKPLPEGVTFISKPYGTKELLKVIRSVLDGS